MRILIFILTLFTFHSVFAVNNNFSINQTDFFNDGKIKKIYTCEGKNKSPEIVWSDAPKRTQSFVLLLTDEDAQKQPYYHWILYNIPKTTRLLNGSPGRLPKGTLIGKNSNEHARYYGPCPPAGASHNYIFSIYALDTKLDLAGGETGEVVTERMQNHIVGKAIIRAVYH